MLNQFAVRIVPASHLTHFASFEEDTRTIELASDVRIDMLPGILADAERIAHSLDEHPDNDD